MRKIKFRVWDKEKKKMIYYDKDCSSPDMTLNGVLISHDKQSNVSYRYELMQFTGLHDKNGKGKEAYAGDRVLWDWNKEHRKIKGLIEWDKEQLAWVITNYYFQNNRKVLLANHPEIEIIGNIHQDKALLETK